MKSHTPLHMIESIVKNALNRHRLTRLVIGLSGGADSTALLRSLVLIKSLETPLTLTAVHCNFHLRGEESDRDELFCRELCERLGIELRVFQCPVDEWRLTHDGSDEMACREMRYSRFRDVMEETDSQAIAIAHNSDDQVETFFLNLMRGAGSTGLSGMSEFKRGLFRPLISVSRKEIEEYLSELNQDYVTDSTNCENVYRRNFIRNRVLPILEEEWPEARKSIRRSMEILGRENEIVEWTLDRLLPKGTKILSRTSVEDYPDPYTLFRRLLEPYGVSAAQLDEIVRTIRLPYSGRRWELGEGRVLWEERDGWALSEPNTKESEITETTFALTDELMAQIRRAPLSEFWSNAGAEFEWRRWREGDRIRPLGMKGSRLVSDILAEAKIPNSEKRWLHVLAVPATNEVLWVPRLKRSRQHLVTTNTSEAIRITVTSD